VTARPSGRARCVLAVGLLAIVAGFARGQSVSMGATEPVVEVTGVTLHVVASASEQELLDVGIAVFDPGIPPDESSHSRLGIFPEIRKAEAQFMPVLLRQVLQASNAWGVVRVLPDTQASTELLLSGRILQSDGQRLVLQVDARDAAGRLWLDRTYADSAQERDYPVAAGTDPFIDLYRQIANDLLAARRQLDSRQLESIRQVALLRYAAGLSEEAFAAYLQPDSEGVYSVVRLPAEGDPMLARVERIRNQEHLFVDTVDEQYVDIYEEMVPTYNLWRQYGLEQAVYKQEFEARAQGRDSAGRRGTFAAMEQAYNTYRQIKIQQQDLDEMALGFNNEVTPTVMEASGKVFRLSGTLAAQYQEWRQILRDIFALETGLPPGG